MTTPRVTVPVEPTEEMIRASLAVEFPATYRDHLRHPDDGPKWREVAEQRIERERKRWSAMLTAAPVREEGGAVLALGTPVEVEFSEAEVGKQTLYVAGVDMAEPGMSEPEYWLSETWPVKCRGDVSTEWKRDLFAALATREEAPAEVGEIGEDLAGIKAAFQGDSVINKNLALRRAYDLLRARPQVREEAQPDTDCVSLLADLDAGKPCGAEAAAVIRQLIKDREEAQPVAWRAASEIHGWLLPRLKHMISFNTFHDVVVKALRSDPTTSPSHAPEAEKLRIALEEAADAIDFFDRVKAATGAERTAVGSDHWKRMEAALRALAALQQEGR